MVKTEMKRVVVVALALVVLLAGCGRKEAAPPPPQASTPPPAQTADSVELSLLQTIQTNDQQIKTYDQWEKQYDSQARIMQSEISLAQAHGDDERTIQQMQQKMLPVLQQQAAGLEAKLRCLAERDKAKIQLAIHYKSGRREDAVRLLKEVSDSSSGSPLGAQALQELHSMGE